MPFCKDADPDIPILIAAKSQPSLVPDKSNYRELTYRGNILDEPGDSVTIVTGNYCGSSTAAFPFWARACTLGSESLLNRQLQEAALLHNSGAMQAI